MHGKFSQHFHEKTSPQVSEKHLVNLVNKIAGMCMTDECLRVDARCHPPLSARLLESGGAGVGLDAKLLDSAMRSAAMKPHLHEGRA